MAACLFWQLVLRRTLWARICLSSGPFWPLLFWLFSRPCPSALLERSADPPGRSLLLAYRWRCCGMVVGATKEPGMCRHRLSQEETEGGCACVPRVVRDARDEKDAQGAHLVRLVSLNQPSLVLCGGSSPLNGTSLCEVADVGRFLFLGFDSDCFGCYALGFWLRARVVFSRRSLRRSLTAMPPPEMAPSTSVGAHTIICAHRP